MSNRFEKSIRAAILAGALTLAGCSASSSGGGSGGGDSSTGGSTDTGGDTGDDGGTTGGGDTGGDTGDTPDTDPPLLLGGTVQDPVLPVLMRAIGSSTVELRFNEPVMWDGDPSQFVLNNTRIREETSSISTAYLSSGGTYPVISGFYASTLSDLPVSATLVSQGSDSTTLQLTFATSITPGMGGDTNLLRLDYTAGSGGVTDLAGNALEPIDWSEPEGRWVPGNVWIPEPDAGSLSLVELEGKVVAPGSDSTAPRLAYGRVVDSTHIALIYTEPIVATGDLAADFQISGNRFYDARDFWQYNTYGPSTYYGTGVSAFSSGDTYSIEDVYPFTDDPSNAVLVILLADPLSEDADGRTGFLRLSYAHEASEIADRAQSPNTVTSQDDSSYSRFPGTVIDQFGPPELARGLPQQASDWADYELRLRFTTPVDWDGAGNVTSFFALSARSSTSNRYTTSYAGTSSRGLFSYSETPLTLNVDSSTPSVPANQGVRHNVILFGMDSGSPGFTNGLRRLSLQYVPAPGGLIDARDGTPLTEDAFNLGPADKGNVFVYDSTGG